MVTLQHAPPPARAMAHPVAKSAAVDVSQSSENGTAESVQMMMTSSTDSTPIVSSDEDTDEDMHGRGQVMTIPEWIPNYAVGKEIIARRDGANDDPFYVVDLTKVESKYYEWVKHLPRIRPHYAVKCNPDVKIVQTLARLGVGFDCASQPEINLALQFGSPSDIVYAHCCKPASQIRHARKMGVDLMTFDNRHELDKIKRDFPSARLLLRVLPDDSRSLCQLGKKFGASLDRVPVLLDSARDLGLDIVGVSFHVGSGCYDATAFSDAVIVAHKAWQMAAERGFNLRVLDVGGGFPGTDSCEPGLSFQEIAAELNGALERYFPDPSIQVIAEPGRFFVHASSTLVLHVIGKRTISNTKSVSLVCADAGSGGVDDTFMYYLNDGVYGSFNCTIFDHYNPIAKVLPRSQSEHDESHARLFECSIWGPTCDSMDCITKKALLPALDIGDYVFFDGMGAYTSTASSTFNGFPVPESHYLRRRTMRP